MATTTPFPFADYARMLPDRAGLEAVIDDLIAEYESALADSDKAGEMDTAAYHEGRTEAFSDALYMLLDVPPEAWEAWRRGWAVTPATADASDPENAPHPRYVIGDPTKEPGSC